MSDQESERPSKIRKLNTTKDLSQGQELENPSMGSTADDIDDEQPSEPTALQEGEKSPVLSKNAQKKLRKKLEWEAGKEWRKAKAKEQRKAKQLKKAEAKKEFQEKIANGEIEAPVEDPVPRPRPRRPIQVPVSFILDCDFNNMMAPKELISLTAQITRCYSDNKTNPYRAHLAVSSWGGTLRKRFETVLANTHLSWKGTHFMEKDFVAAAAELDDIMRGPDGGVLAGAIAGEGHGTSEIAQTDSLAPSSLDSLIQGHSEAALLAPDTSTPVKPPKSATTEKPRKSDGATNSSKAEPSIIYLSSDSPNTLERLSPNTTYVIGGLVDKNRYKGLCYKRACERGIPTAKLPIGEYMMMQSRTVLTVNHVVEIMLKWLETGNWGDAFLNVIPKRKEAKLRREQKAEEDGNEGEGHGHESEEDNEDGGVAISVLDKAGPTSEKLAQDKDAAETSLGD